MPDETESGRPVENGLSDRDRAEFKRRSSELGRRLETQRPREPGPSRASKTGGAFAQALKMALEPLVGVLFGVFVGLTLDNALGTRPAFLIIFLLLGAIAGMLNLIRSATRTQGGPTPDKPPASGKSGEARRENEREIE